MNFIEALFALISGLFLTDLVLVAGPAPMPEQWLGPGMEVLMRLAFFLLVVFLVLAILALIKYLWKK